MASTSSNGECVSKQRSLYKRHVSYRDARRADAAVAQSPFRPVDIETVQQYGRECAFLLANSLVGVVIHRPAHSPEVTP
jgi:hypothetical protein